MKGDGSPLVLIVTSNLDLTRALAHHVKHAQMQYGIEDTVVRKMLANASLPDRASLLTVSSPHASIWLSATPSPGLKRYKAKNKILLQAMC